MSTFDPKALRQVYGQFPTGVTVITTRTVDGEPIGMTASSFNTVSIDPPLILWSIDKNAYSLETFKQCDYFAVNILSDQQIALSNRFAGRGEDKFKGLDYTNGAGDCPLLPKALAQLQCKNWQVYEGGDHLIMVGEVIEYQRLDNTRPLVFSQGTYAQASQHVETFDAPQTELFEQQDFLNNHLPYLLRSAYNHVSRSLYQRLNAATGVNPEMWRVYACLADGQTMPLETLAGYVMQPLAVLRDTLGGMGAANIQFDADSAQLTEAGVRLAQQLLAIAIQNEAELSDRLQAVSLTALKHNLRYLS